MSNATQIVTMLLGVFSSSAGFRLAGLVAATVVVIVVGYLIARRRRALPSDPESDLTVLSDAQSFTPPMRVKGAAGWDSSRMRLGSDVMAMRTHGQKQPLLWVASDSDTGLNRDHNEDALLIDIKIGLLMVADGIGGSQAGEVASSLATKVIAQYVEEHFWNEQIQDVLYKAVINANQRIYERAAENPTLTGMGTTIVAALCTSDTLYIVHLGDSRAYFINHSSIRQITNDHTIVAALILKGQLTKEEALVHPKRHVITKWLGSQEALKPELNIVAWDRGDYLLLCTDGLTDMVDDPTIKAIVIDAEKSLNTKCQNLIAAANERGGLDNITVVLACHS